MNKMNKIVKAFKAGFPSHSEHSVNSVKTLDFSHIKMFVPLTLSGWVMIGLAGGLFFGGLQLRDVVLWIGAISLTGYLLYAFFACALTFFAIRRVFYRPAANGLSLSWECHKEQPTGWTIPMWARAPLVEVSLRWTLPAGVESWLNSRGQEVARPLRRGLSSSISRGIEITDVFRLLSLRVEAESLATVTILPAGRQPRDGIPFTAGQGGEVFSMTGRPEGDRFNLRGYIPGDPLKFVMWRRMTPDGQYYVRLPDTVEAPHVTILFLVGEADDASAELARFLVETEPMGSAWSFRVSSSPEMVSTRSEALRLLSESGNHRPDGAGMVIGCHDLAEVARNSQGAYTVLLVPDHRAVGEIGTSLIGLCDVVLCGESKMDEYALQHPGVVRVKMQGGGGAV
jgi:hypothetical protein